ncbi:hypothetical protein [Arthrobacter methylotrophus]|uniref:hypothetical protein n=1 Tax=Arthrobacter methylotrophus TaxID=121291 RepID=UPI0031E5FE84
MVQQRQFSRWGNGVAVRMVFHGQVASWAGKMTGRSCPVPAGADTLDVALGPARSLGSEAAETAEGLLTDGTVPRFASLGADRV